jgi:hypothetical protein
MWSSIAGILLVFHRGAELIKKKKQPPRFYLIIPMYHITCICIVKLPISFLWHDENWYKIDKTRFSLCKIELNSGVARVRRLLILTSHRLRGFVAERLRLMKASTKPRIRNMKCCKLKEYTCWSRGAAIVIAVRNVSSRGVVSPDLFGASRQIARFLWRRCEVRWWAVLLGLMNEKDICNQL